MGTDCTLFDGVKYYSLDRWYVFSESFELLKEYSRREIIYLLEKEKLRLIKENCDEFLMNKVSYYLSQISDAIMFILDSKSDKFAFYTDNDLPDEYFENKLYLE